ncbi:MAG TPA: hypothetical protein VNX29_09490 [Kaistia sp.]|nr:hypothetical protein [Kaistia sp.]
MTGIVLKKTFHAWINKMPGAGDKLIVVGMVVFPTTGWTVELEEAVPPGINPSILVLEEREIPPVGGVAMVLTHELARFERPNGGAYQQVTIRTASEEFTIDVMVVS